jgi:hypothetical protein
MKREVERERVLPAFSLSVGELELLVSRLVNLFDDPSKVYSSIDVRLPSEKLAFSTVNELSEYKQLPSRIASFSIWLSHQDKRVVVRSGQMIATRAHVSAKAETEHWCAGAIDTAYTFVASHRVWYGWFVSAPIGWALFALANVPGIAVALLPKDYRIGQMFIVGWGGTLLSLLLLYFAREKLLPSAVIRVSESGGFIRNHIAELSLAIAILSAALTVVGWFVAR